MAVMDPMKLKDLLWPDVYFYREQRDIIYSVEENTETVVVASNQVGKDFVTAFIVLSYFLRHPVVRVVTTSVDDTQLKVVLWGEMTRFIQTARSPLCHTKGGPLIINEKYIRKQVNGEVCGISYIIGRVAAKGESMAGHHAPATLFVVDEASGVGDDAFDQASTWSKRRLFIGNPNPTTNYFKRAVKAGDLAMIER